eukprot:915802-Rhodomonas_salina.1
MSEEQYRSHIAAITESNKRSPNYVKKDKFFEMCKVECIPCTKNTLCSTMLLKYMAKREREWNAQMETKYNLALTVFTRDFFWQSRGVDSIAAIGKMASTCRVCRFIDRDEDIWRRVVENAQRSLALKYPIRGDDQTMRGYLLPMRLYNELQRYVAAYRVFTGRQHMAINVDACFEIEAPMPESVEIATKLEERPRKYCVENSVYKAYSYFAKETDTEDERIALLFPLLERVPKDPQERVRQFVCGNTVFGSLMSWTPLGFFEANGYDMTKYKMDFWKRERERERDDERAEGSQSRKRKRV